MKLSNVLTSLTALLVGVLGTPLSAQYDPTANHCEFISPQSTWVHNNVAYDAGRLHIEWSPWHGEVAKYEWFFDARNRGASVAHHNKVLYSRFDGGDSLVEAREEYSAALNVTVTNVLATTTGFANNTIAGVLHPQGGRYAPEWVYSGLLAQTGTTSIAATGTVRCR